MAKKRKSRLERLENKRANRSTFVYITLSIVALYLLTRFGISALTGVIAFVGDYVGSEDQVSINDSTIPPPPANLDDIPRFVNQQKITVTGSATPGYDVIVVNNGEKIEVIANAQGEFSVSLQVSETKPNIIYAIVQSPSKKQSKDSERYSVTYDNEPPELEIIAPGNEIFGESNRQTKIEGQTEPDAQVTINERIAIVKSDGKFSFNTRLEDGENIFKIISKDPAGNETETEKKINFIK